MIAITEPSYSTTASCHRRRHGSVDAGVLMLLRCASVPLAHESMSERDARAPQEQGVHAIGPGAWPCNQLHGALAEVDPDRKTAAPNATSATERSLAVGQLLDSKGSERTERTERKNAG